MTVDHDGALHFSSTSENEARDFLRGLGLQRHPVSGWSKPGWLGLLQVCRGEWHAAAWECER